LSTSLSRTYHLIDRALHGRKQIVVLSLLILAVVALVEAGGHFGGQNAALVTFGPTDTRPLYLSSPGPNILSNITAWDIRSYYTAANFSLQGGSVNLDASINQTVPEGKSASAFFEIPGLNVSAQQLPYLVLNYNQTMGSALIVRLGIDMTIWNQTVAYNQALAKARWGGNTTNIVWVQYLDPPPGRAGSLEVIYGSNVWTRLSVDWQQYLHEALNATVTQLRGLQIIVGFTGSSRGTLQIDNISFSSVLTYQAAPSSSPMPGTTVFVFSPEYPLDKQGQMLGPERVRVDYDMTSLEPLRYTLIAIWSDTTGELHLFRNGFLLDASDGPKSLWVDFWTWNEIRPARNSIEPFSSLQATMKIGDIALFFQELDSFPNPVLRVNVSHVNLFLSNPSPAQITLPNNLGPFIQITALYLVALALPAVGVFGFYLVRRKTGYIHTSRWIGTIVGVGLIIRLALAPISAHPIDGKQYCDMGPLYFGSGRLFDMWVDFPFSYYTFLMSALPYAVLQVFGFIDVSYLAMPCPSAQLFFTKVPPIIADIIGYVFLCKMVGMKRRSFSSFAPELYFLNPITILTSASWAHLNSLYLSFMIVGMYYLSQARPFRAAWYTAFSGMTIPVGLSSLLASLAVSIKRSGWRLTISSGVIAALASVALVLAAPSRVAFSLFQRLVGGQVASNPVYSPPLIVIAGQPSYSYAITGYKIFRVFETLDVPIPQAFFTISLALGLSIDSFWFVRNLRILQNNPVREVVPKIDLVLRYLLIVVGVFLLFYYTTNTIWNFWPVLFLLLLSATCGKVVFAALGMITSYVMLFGMDFIERLSLFATGYSFQFYSAIGLNVPYFISNLVVSTVFSVLIAIEICLAVFYGKPHGTRDPLGPMDNITA